MFLSELPYAMIIVCITNILQTVLIRQAMEIFLEKRAVEEKLYLAAYILYYGVVTAVYCFDGAGVWYAGFAFCGMLAAAMLYDGSRKKRLWTAVSFFCIDLCCLLAAAFFFGGPGWGGVQEMAIGALLFLVSVTLIRRSSCADALRQELPGKKETFLLSVTPLTGILVLSAIALAEPRKREAAAVACIGVLLVNLTVFYLYDAVLGSYKRLRERDIYRQQTDIYKNQMEIIMESGRRIRSLRHDMKNHILALEQLAAKGSREELRSYVRDMQQFLLNPQEYAATGNEEIDGVLNYKLRRAKALSCSVKMKLCVPKELRLQSFDLNVILGNLLDNAVEAAIRTEEKRLEVALSAEKGVLFLTVLNSCGRCGQCRAGVPPRLKSTKSDRANHGFGLANVRRIVEKYQGEIDFVCEDGCFTADVMLYMKEL